MTVEQGRTGTGRASSAQPTRTEAWREAAFRRARSHSRRVKLLKFALPVAAVLMAVGFAAYSYLSVPGSISFDVSKSGYADGKFVMANPKLEGFTKDSRPYSMKATRATQHVKNSAVIELEGIDARLPIGGDTFAMVGAESGTYDNDKNTLDIPSPITVETTDGMKATLKSAYVNIAGGNLETKDPVDIKMDGVQLSAEAMRVLENGKVLIFDRSVKLVLAPGRIKNQSATAEKPADQAVQN